MALLLTTGIGFLLFLPVPSWYVYRRVSTALVLNYLMAGPAMAVFRKLAPQLPRPVRIPLPGLWGAAGCAAS